MSNPSSTALAESKQQADIAPSQQQKKPPVLEEDDEFEDFPVEGTLAAAIHPHFPLIPDVRIPVPSQLRAVDAALIIWILQAPI
jgi:hypothetical protein